MSPRAVGAMVGFGGVTLVSVTCFLLGSGLPTTVPALLLLVPIIGASMLADWRVAVPVAAPNLTSFCWILVSQTSTAPRQPPCQLSLPLS